MRPLAERLREQQLWQMSQYMREAIEKIGQNGDFSEELLEKLLLQSAAILRIPSTWTCW